MTEITLRRNHNIGQEIIEELYHYKQKRSYPDFLIMGPLEWTQLEVEMREKMFVNPAFKDDLTYLGLKVILADIKGFTFGWNDCGHAGQLLWERKKAVEGK